MLNIRNAAIADFERIMEIYSYAQDYMIRTGNPTQWGHFYPEPALVQSDIRQNVCKVIYDEKGIHGVFALFEGADPTYVHIENGAWLNDEPYVTIHRLAGDGTVHGLFQCVVDYCKNLYRNIRVDTHADNQTMQRLIEKNGFAKCGIIHVEDGSPRIAYHRTATVLFVNACVRKESRTKRLADYLLSKLSCEVKEVRLENIDFPAASENFLAERDRLLQSGNFGAPMFTLAREFAAADTIVIAAPFWDLSFPAALKQYFEQITVLGITFRYSDEGVPMGLCKAKNLYYVTTAGGTIFSESYGFGYVQALAQGFYGIPDVKCIKAEGLDIVGCDVEKILSEAMAAIDEVAYA